MTYLQLEPLFFKWWMSWAESTPCSLLCDILGKQHVLQEVDCSLPTVFMSLKREDLGFHWVPCRNLEGVRNE